MLIESNNVIRTQLLIRARWSCPRKIFEQKENEKSNREEDGTLTGVGGNVPVHFLRSAEGR